MKNEEPNKRPVHSPLGKVQITTGRIRLKICGMKNVDNIQDVAELQPDYMGFIFYEKSPRFVESDFPEINPAIKKTGIFVNTSLEFIQQKIKQYDLQAVQLHGNESPEFCKELKELSHRACRDVNSKNDVTNPDSDKLSPTVGEKEMSSRRKRNFSFPIEIIKAFSLKDQFDFQVLKPYLEVVDYFLFDTKGKHYGGNGKTFNWDLLENYPFKKRFFLSGGIGVEHAKVLQSFQQKNLPLYAIDVNSKFETKPGKKDVKKLKEFIKNIKH